MSKSGNPASGLHDELLVVRCQLGDPQAFEELVQSWADPLLRHVQRIAGKEGAEDVAQEVWLRALRGIVRVRDGTRLRSWLFSVAHHVLMDRLRLDYVEREMLEDMANEPAAETPDPFEPLLAGLDDELARLPIVERETVTLFYFEELSLLQIAEVQAVPVGTVKSRLFRARGMLRQSMQKGTSDEG